MLTIEELQKLWDNFPPNTVPDNALTGQDFEKLWSECYIENYIPEMAALLKFVEGLNPLKTVLEIGTGLGGTARLWEAVLPPGEGMVIGVDHQLDIVDRWTGKIKVHTDCCPAEFGNWELEWQKDNVAKFKSDRDIYLVTGESEAPETLATVKSILNGRLVDYLFHDGAHWFHIPLWDYEQYQHVLRTGGLLCVADISQLAEDPMAGCQAVYLALPEPKLPAVIWHGQGMGIWFKQEGFVFDAQEVIDRLKVVGNDGELQARRVEMGLLDQHEEDRLAELERRRLAGL